jgi:hypothetical protein
LRKISSSFRRKDYSKFLSPKILKWA